MQAHADQQRVTLPDVLITSQLAGRAGRPPDYAAENRALVALAKEMAATPGNAPQKLVDLALELCRAGGSGISLIKADTNGEFFYWQAVAGSLAAQAGGCGPRDSSPCGVALKRHAPQLFRYPERYFTYLDRVKTPIPETLVVPLYAAGRPLGTIWIMTHDERRRFDAEDARLLRSLGEFTGAALRPLASLDAERRAHEEQLKANAALQQEIHRRCRAETALRTSEAQYRTLFGSIDEGFCVIEMLFDDNGKSVDYRFLEINPTFEKQTGLKQAVNKTARALAPKLGAHWFEIYGNVALTGKPVRLENVADGLNRWFDVYAFRVGRPEDRKVAILFKDATARKRGEDTLRKQHERQRLLSEATGMLLSTVDADALFPALFAKIAQHLEMDAYCNFMINEARDAVQVESYTGLPAEALHGLMLLKFRQDVRDGMVLSGRPLVLTNIQQSGDPGEQLLKGLGFRACACNPLTLDDRLLGVLWFGSRSRNSFDEDELELLKTITRYVTMAHERLRLIRQLQESDRRKEDALEALRIANAELDRRVLERTSVAEQRAAQLRTLAAELSFAEERERQNLAADLHDDLSQALSLARLKLSSLRTAVRAKTAQRRIEEVAQLVRHANESVRAHIFDLSPPVLDDFGLIKALEWLAEDVQKTRGLKVRIRHDGYVAPIDKRIRFTLFRAARELLINVAKHAGTDHAAVALENKDRHLALRVEDSGDGFDPAQAACRRSGFGLLSIRERLSYLGGDMHIESARGQGARITLLAPVARHNGE
ncbi:MAG: GAF domain-containing protein [Gammaproteobacteria bacterium]